MHAHDSSVKNRKRSSELKDKANFELSSIDLEKERVSDALAIVEHIDKNYEDNYHEDTLTEDDGPDHASSPSSSPVCTSEQMQNQNTYTQSGKAYDFMNSILSSAAATAAAYCNQKSDKPLSLDTVCNEVDNQDYSISSPNILRRPSSKRRRTGPCTPTKVGYNSPLVAMWSAAPAANTSSFLASYSYPSQPNSAPNSRYAANSLSSPLSSTVKKPRKTNHMATVNTISFANNNVLDNASNLSSSSTRKMKARSKVRYAYSTSRAVVSCSRLA